MATAFELTRPAQQGRYEVTVYQLGWRLGGKGASGRGRAGRIEEHGLHLWLGFYDNAFALLRECYAELGRDPARFPIARWHDAIRPDAFVGIADRDSSGGWLKWSTCFPPGEGLPGDPLDKHNPFTLTQYLLRTFELVRSLLLDLRTHKSGAAPGTGGDADPAPATRPRRPPTLDAIERLIRYGIVGTAAGISEVISLLELAFPVLHVYPGPRVAGVLRTIAESIRREFEDLIERDDESRCKWEILDLVFAILTGFARHRLLLDPRGLDAINEYECRDWLRENGASERALDGAFVRGLYDLALAYEGGDPTRPALAAGQAVRGALRMFFTYRGQLFWKLQLGMGDAVFAPYYEVLKRRGVRFQFFHRLTGIGCAEQRSDSGAVTRYVDRLDFDVQAQVRGGAEYAPLIDVQGVPSWPAAPLYDQLESGTTAQAEQRDFESDWDQSMVTTRQLTVGRDFDFAVLAIGGGAVAGVAKELMAAEPRWRVAVQNINTVATQAFQIWMREDMNALGWTEPPITLSAFAKPFDTWADMRHLLEHEQWRDNPRALAYFCGVLADPVAGEVTTAATYPARRRDEVRDNAIRFLNEQAHALWPQSVRDGAFRWELLCQPDDNPVAADTRAVEVGAATGTARFDSQYWTANVNATDRYVLALPGTLKHRLSPLSREFDNLTVAGDWTDSGFNEGCVEAAVMSGRLAAHALCGAPALEDIIGYDHP